MSVKVTKMKGNKNKNNNSYFLSYQTRNIKKLQKAISPVLVGQEYPSGDQIQGLDTIRYPIDLIG